MGRCAEAVIFINVHSIAAPDMNERLYQARARRRLSVSRDTGDNTSVS